jgi:tRNA nucleotidyltransferase (CCA-adding enzyme)
MISHGPDASAVAAAVARDPVLARIEWPDSAPRTSLVGGAVRDAILGVAHGPDLDLVVEGDAIALARVLGRALGGRVLAHPRFGTARIEFAHGRHLDMVTARREAYARPGALPDVTPGTLDDDLARRDFTVNAIAFVLHGDGAAGIIDPHGGRDDIVAERIRLIRPGAFEEDPSRLVRGLRYAARLGFRMDVPTEAEARAIAPGVSLDSSRVADEAARMLSEDAAPLALGMAQALGAGWPDPDPLRDDRLNMLPVVLARAGAPAPPTWALRLGLGVDEAAVRSAAVPQWARGVAAEVRVGLATAPLVTGASRPSEVDALLRDLPAAQQVGALVAGAEAVARWWAEWRDAAPAVSGADLVAAGVAPGPAIGRALRAVRAAVLDGEAGEPEQQLAIALAVAGGRA